MLLLVLFSGAAGCGPAAQPPVPARVQDWVARRVVIFSDLHFNPFSDPSLVDSLARADVSLWRGILSGSAQKAFSQYGSDTNYPLLESALAAMQRTEPDPALVLFAGDFLAHNFQSTFRKRAHDTSAAALAAFAARTNQFLARRIAAAFPRAQILPALGNNDAVCGDYMSEPGSAFLRAFADAWQPLVNRHGSAPDFAEAFARAGHYAARAPALETRVVVLNDVYWSPRYSNACGSALAHPGRDALGWLARVLAESRLRSERVLLLTHAPVGVDVFATLKGDTLVNMLEPVYVAELTALLRRYGPMVRLGIHGHTHMNEFRVISDSDGSPLLGSQGIPAVSPIFGNNPAFVVMSFDSTSGAPTDYVVYALSNLSSAGAGAPALWSSEYDFREAYGGAPSALTFQRVEQALASDSSIRASFLRFYDSGSGRARISRSWRAYWCSFDNIDPAAFTRCAGRP